MSKITCYVFAVLSLCTQTVHAQEKKPAAEKTYTIPFQLTDRNNLSVQAILNNKDTVQLMFHTAADDVTLTEDAVKRLSTIVFAGADSVKSWGGADNTSRFSKSNLLQIGAQSWDHVEIWENKNSGPHTDGKFGPNLFENKVIEIDFDKKLITVSAALPAKVKNYEKLKLTFERNMMFVEASCIIGNNTFSNKLLIHSGYSGGILFDDKFANENKLADQLKIIDEKQLKDSYGNILKTKKAILPVLIIGNEKLADVPAGFFDGAIGRQKMSVIGGDILKRFNIVIDAQREYIYLKANKLKKTDYTNV